MSVEAMHWLEQHQVERLSGLFVLRAPRGARMGIVSHEELRAFLDQARSRLSLVEVLVYKGDRLSDVIFGKVASVSLSSVELKVKGSAGATVYFDFSSADVRPYKREKPLEGWRLRFANRETLVFLELPQLEIAA